MNRVKEWPSKWSDLKRTWPPWKRSSVSSKSSFILVLTPISSICSEPAPKISTKVIRIIKLFVRNNSKIISFYFISLGDLLLIVEYCRFGNLQSYLINHRSRFVNQLDQFGMLKPDYSDDDVIEPLEEELEKEINERWEWFFLNSTFALISIILLVIFYRVHHHNKTKVKFSIDADIPERHRRESDTVSIESDPESVFGLT